MFIRKIYDKMVEQYEIEIVKQKIRGDIYGPMHPIPFLILMAAAIVSLILGVIYL